MDTQPLSTASPGQRLRIADIADKRARLRLLSLGLAPGTTVTVLRNRGGSVIVGHHHSRTAIGQLLAQRILVREDPS